MAPVIRAKAPFSVLWGGAFIVVFGITKVIFGVQMILVMTVLGAAIGPLSLLTLNIIDFSIGILATAVGFFFATRRRWAAKLFKIGWLPLVFYEVGRALGLAAAGIGIIADGKDLFASVALLLLLISAGICATSSATEAYLRPSTQHD